MVRPQRRDTLADQPPDESRRHVEQVAGHPSQRRRILAPGVEKPPAVVEGAPPLGFRHAGRLLALEPRPGVEIAGQHAIGRQRRALFDGVEIVCERGGYGRGCALFCALSLAGIFEA
jgi:hypothetical protein